MKNIMILVTLIITFTNNIHAESIRCSGVEGDIVIDYSKQQLTLTEFRAIELSELLLGHRNISVEKIFINIDLIKMTRGGIINIKAITNATYVTILFIDGSQKLIKVDGGILTASFRAFYGIGLRGSLTLLKAGAYTKINIYNTHENCITGV